ncbi:MAG: RNA-binding S4 domain-containing protein, partial [Muribaculaceae bacterium]|nr:RNA-binding S4 domain-containing protein [Muribaculaceae bacterium]
DYLENITPKSQDDLLEMTKISGFGDRRKGMGRPTKRDSREMSRFKEDSYADTYFLDWEDDDDDFDSED